MIQRMLSSPYAQVQQWGGFLAARAGLEFGLGHLLAAALESDAAQIRLGAADLCARSLPYTSDTSAVTVALRQFLNDQDEGVRKAGGQVVAELRNHPSQPFRELLAALVASAAFTEALPQLLYTLQAAPDRIDEIVLQCTQRFIDIHGKDAGDISTSAAGDAQMITQLTLRAYAQASGREVRSKTTRSASLVRPAPSAWCLPPDAIPVREAIASILKVADQRLEEPGRGVKAQPSAGTVRARPCAAQPATPSARIHSGRQQPQIEPRNA